MKNKASAIDAGASDHVDGKAKAKAKAKPKAKAKTTLNVSVVGPDDARTTLVTWQQKLDRDVQEARSLMIRLSGVEYADQLTRDVDGAAKAHSMLIMCASLEVSVCTSLSVDMGGGQV